MTRILYFENKFQKNYFFLKLFSFKKKVKK